MSKRCIWNDKQCGSPIESDLGLHYLHTPIHPELGIYVTCTLKILLTLFSKDSLKTLEEAHRLVNVNLHNSAQYRRECETAEEVNKATVERLERMESELTEVRGQLERVRGEREKAEEEWRNKVNEKI